MDVKIITFKGWWKENDAKNNPTWLFVFGDNDIKKGLKGQAVIRNCSNAIGIPTKKYPSLMISSFYSDDEYKLNCKKIDNAICDIIVLLKTKKYDHIIFPEDGLGTGLAELPKRAPKTYDYLNKSIKQLKNSLK